MSRRAFLGRGALTAAAVGLAGSVPGLSGLVFAGAADAPELDNSVAQGSADLGGMTGPLVAHVDDLGSGKITLFNGQSQVVVRDADLARRLFSSARR
ncbi:MAG: hypothetical protein JO337_01995 [Acidimicrobiales bacterium]|nr:hypothetical protein [Acidimicrobiales bacterium]